ncbi:hypothetical protein BTO20_11575 [Mycobacterium dioxanotrophicus]|uniref:Uncharacterized protein n=2 Tax=Mycobacterium dioxanotrophicus TaxID=482462 RepID=A0A1Y0C1X1_9MYCO|nr:hypothetical protein BTO20_11575 [Mycobacterium dioxanotrophicus]
MWPWQRHRAERRKARSDREIAAAQANAAEVQREAAKKLAAQSRTVTARLRFEIDKNGWTELLQNAWGAR